MRTFVRDAAGIVLAPEKDYLIQHRVSELARNENLSPQQLFVRIRRLPRGELGLKLLDAMTVNETSFFRDSRPFDALRTEILPDIIQRRSDSRSLSIWCAACSTGQEPYSVAMLLREHFPQLATWRVKITATDLCRTVLAKARGGVFAEHEINRGLDRSMLTRYFDRDGPRWRARTVLKNLIDFQPINLTRKWANLQPMDVVLLRNVLIYFDERTKVDILNRMGTTLREDGVLLLGSSERLANGTSSLYTERQGQVLVHRPVRFKKAA